MKDAFLRSSDEVLGALKVDRGEGLSSAEVAARAAKYGPNELPAAEPTPFFKLVLKQFEDLLVLILLGAAGVSFGLAMLESGDDLVRALMEPAVILLILIANAIVGVLQESSAESSINALRKSEARYATVYRNGGQLETVESAALVPGDIVEVDVGAKVPADCRVLEVFTATLSVDEAMLTGENVPSSKITDAIEDEKATTGDKHNMLFSGTLVVRGKGLAVVTKTGAKTAMGEIAKSLDEEEEEKTPLQVQLDDFGEQLSKIIAIICVVVILINVNHFGDEEHGGYVKGLIYYFKIGVALAVAAIPEGLPAVVTTCLALGTMKMARKNAIVRSLPSVETLGCTTVICSDKTGTLTTNMMSVQRVLAVRAVNSADGTATFRTYAVEGDSFAPYGRVVDAETETVLPTPAAQDPALAEISRVATLCNESTLQYEEEEKGKGVYGKSGTPTEAALKVLAEKLGVDDEAATDRIFQSRDPLVRVSAVSSFYQDQYERERLLEFSRDRKSMSVVVRNGDRRVLLCKGAPEGVLDRCSGIHCPATGETRAFTGAMRADVEDQVADMASRGLRCLALAYLNDPEEDQEWADIEAFGSIESEMTFVGVVGMMDPPRPEVADAIARCRQAHIRVIVITGDHKATAETICRMIGVFGPEESTKGRSFTGAEFNDMSEEEQDQALRNAALFSRVEPKHKHRLLTILKNQGEVTAMTGDGVNDAPALKAAHIGVAMGSGTDVAREASDMVLADDNFSTIVMAVEEGRAIYANACAFIRYLISSNIGEVACIFLQAALGIPEALIPVQLLWVNLVTDGLPATALGFNEPDKDVMLKPPRDRKSGIISGWVFFRYMTIGIYVGVATVAGFVYWYLAYEEGPQITFQQLSNFHACGSNMELFPAGFDCGIFHAAAPSTVALSILVVIEMLNAANAVSENQSLLVVPVWRNMWLVLAIMLSFGLHLGIVYIPTFADIFSVSPISWAEWEIVWVCSVPVLLLDEVLKFVARRFPASPLKKVSKRKRAGAKRKKPKRA